MPYQSRIPQDPEYVLAIGQAHYNFTYLELVVVWTIVRLSEKEFQAMPKPPTAGALAGVLEKSIEATTPPLAKDLRAELIQFQKRFLEAKRTRDKLIHSHPFTAAGGVQRLQGGGIHWEVERVNEAAKLFEDVAIFGNDIFHNRLLKVRPLPGSGSNTRA